MQGVGDKDTGDGAGGVRGLNAAQACKDLAGEERVMKEAKDIPRDCWDGEYAPNARETNPWDKPMSKGQRWIWELFFAGLGATWFIVLGNYMFGR